MTARVIGSADVTTLQKVAPISEWAVAAYGALWHHEPTRTP